MLNTWILYYLELNRDNWVLSVAETPFSHVLQLVLPRRVLELVLLLCCAVLCCAVPW
jgi:hypothetical protein